MRSIRITSGGNTPRSWNAAVRFLPSAICWPARCNAASRGWLATISSQLRIALRTVMPAAYIMAKVAAERHKPNIVGIQHVSGVVLGEWQAADSDAVLVLIASLL